MTTNASKHLPSGSGVSDSEGRSGLMRLIHGMAAPPLRLATHYRLRLIVSLARAEILRRINGLNGAADYIYRSVPPAMLADVLRHFGASIGKDVIFKSHFNIEASVFSRNRDFRNLTIADRCLITRDVYVDLTEKVTLMEEATLSPHVMILTHQSVGNRPLSQQYPTMCAPVVVGPGAWVGAGAQILAGVTIGECAVVAAGSIVLRDVDAFTVVAGAPAKRVKTIQNHADVSSQRL